MEPMDQKIERIKELLREAYAILGTFDEPNIRSVIEHHENLALLTGQPKPGPFVNTEPEVVVIPPPPSEDE